MSESLSKAFDLSDEVTRFVKVIPTEPVEKDTTLDTTGRKLGTKLNRLPSFASHHGTDMGLSNAHNPVINALDTIIIHFLLLSKHFTNDQQYAITSIAQTRQRCSSSYQLINGRIQPLGEYKCHQAMEGF
jgi:hypothetical protein